MPHACVLAQADASDRTICLGGQLREHYRARTDEPQTVHPLFLRYQKTARSAYQ
jgi:hypothetical protein